MKAPALTPARRQSAEISSTSHRVLQRCSCGSTPGPTGECAECRRKRLLQSKLVVNAPGDRYEQEADRVADRVMRAPVAEEPSSEPLRIQRVGSETGDRYEQEADGVAQHGAGGAPVPLLLQRVTDGRAAVKAPAVVHEVLRTAGRPLEPDVQTFMERRFKHDFSQVRVHADARAAASAEAVTARAYTVGRDIVFGEGEYAPETVQGRHLLAHELAHVLQQGHHRALPSSLRVASTADPAERAAARAAEGGAPPSPAPVALYRLPPWSRMPDDPIEFDSMLSYREATELAACVRIMGDANLAHCRREVLGEEPQHPTHHQVPGISTPQPFHVQAGPTGSTTFSVNGIQVVFLPDTRSAAPRMAGRAKTNFRISAYRINPPRMRNGRVTSYTGPGTPTVTIQTTYGRDVTAAGPSGYGRGTTAADVAAGNTSLGFHEGQHGLDFVRFLQTHPFPQFTGAADMTTTEWQQATAAYAAARIRFAQEMEAFSEQRTDCVGTTTDAHNQGNAIISTICTQHGP